MSDPASPARVSWRQVITFERELLARSRGLVLVWLLLAVGGALLSVGSAVALGRFADVAVRAEAWQPVLYAAAAMGGLSLGAGLARSGAVWAIEAAVARGLAALRIRTFAALQRKDLDALTSVGFDEVYHRLTEGVERMREAMRLFLTDFVFHALAGLAGLAVIIRINLWIPVLCAGVYGPYIVIRRRLMGRLGQHWNAHLALYPPIVRVVREAVEGNRTVKIHSAVDTELSRLDTRQADYLNALRLHLRALCQGGALNFVMFLLPEGLVYLYVGSLVFAGRAPLGDLLTVVALFPFFRQMIWHISRMSAHRREHGVHIARLLALRDLADEPFPHERGRRGTLTGSVEFRGVTVRLGEVPVLIDFDLTVHSGERLGIVGLSGAGKSTIAGLLVGLRAPDHGTVLIDDVPLAAWSIDDLRTQIAYLSQDVFLVNASIRANLRYGIDEPGDDALWSALKQADLSDTVESWPAGLDTVVGERGIQLSGGQRQRLAIARSYLRDPRILVMDESTSALDTIAEHRVQQAQDRLGAGRTILSIAHRLNTVRGADRIVVIDQGRIVEQGRHEELVNSGGLYARLYNRQRYRGDAA